MTQDPFFIIGSGRSGSTLLRMILASHSRLSIPPETWFLLPLTAQLSIESPLDETAVQRALQIITGHYRWPDMGIDASSFRETAKALNAPYLRDIIEIVYLEHLKREGKFRWGDKTPGYIKIVPQLARLFPSALFIHLIRDGRDVAMSFKSVGWYGQSLHRNTREWTEALDYSDRWRRSRLSKRIHTVRYEDLIQDTERTVRKLCLFLGETFEPQMLAWEENVARLVPLREMAIHGKLNRKPGRSDTERWKREMAIWEVFVAEAFMGRHLQRSGYERKFSSRVWTPVFAVARFCCQTIFPIIAVGRRGAIFLRKKLTDNHKPAHSQRENR